MAMLAIACPGQGAQHPAMFDLALQSDVAVNWLAEYSHALGVDVVKLARAEQHLFSNRNGQILMCGATVATWVALREHMTMPDVVLGYSVGEMSAYGCAGTWTAAQLAHIVGQRAEWMDRAAPANAGLMAVKGLDAAQIKSICLDFDLALAIINADDHVILGGQRIALARAADAIAADGFWCQLLDVAVPAHTPAMCGAVDGFRAALQQSGIVLPSIPVLAGIDGCAADNAHAIVDTLTAQIVQPVRWQDCMRAAVEYGVTVVLELGPGKSLSRMFSELGGPLESRSVDDFRTLSGIAKWVHTRFENA